MSKVRENVEGREQVAMTYYKIEVFTNILEVLFSPRHKLSVDIIEGILELLFCDKLDGITDAFY